MEWINEEDLGLDSKPVLVSVTVNTQHRKAHCCCLNAHTHTFLLVKGRTAPAPGDGTRFQMRSFSEPVEPEKQVSESKVLIDIDSTETIEDCD